MNWLVLVLCMLMQDANPLAQLGQSLPTLEGEVALPGLLTPVAIERDGRGVPAIRASSLVDVVRAQGYVHGQDRFAQMDLMRRNATGELAELIGQYGVERDRALRVYGFRRVAEASLARLEAGDRALLEAYAEGVNAGMLSLAAPPPEYAMAGVAPRLWEPVDSLLILFSMFESLNFGASIERSVGVMEAVLPESLVDFLTPMSARLDAPMVREPGGGNGYVAAAIPGPEVIDLRTRRSNATPRDLIGEVPVAIGSNNWAIAGARTVHGAAIVANDPHLALSAPNIWYRVDLHAGEHHLSGASLPGVPLVVIGTNGAVAWGFTNTYGDFQDLVIVEVDPDDPERYRTPDGWRVFERDVETIRVMGMDPIEVEVRRTIWGPIVDQDWEGRPLALRWTALDPELLGDDLFGYFEARDVEEMIERARTWWGPSQNVVVASGERIGWTVSGAIPKRVGFDGRTPRSWADGDRRWEGGIDESERPVIIDPPGGVLWSANNRTIPVAMARRLGAIHAPGGRAARIHERLHEMEAVDEGDLLELQLDTRCLVMDFYRALMLEMIDEDDADELLREARRVAVDWNGRSDLDSVGLALIETVRRDLRSWVLSPLVESCRDLDPRFRYRWMLAEEPAQRILEERPEHLLPPDASSWRSLVRIAVRNAAARQRSASATGVIGVPWSARSVPVIAHPLAQAAPMYRQMLTMTPVPVPGHASAVRVVSGSFGASLRMVVSPAHLDAAIFHMPAGQSGHPMSPHFRDGHDDWVQGAASPLLPEEAAKTLRLVPVE